MAQGFLPRKRESIELLDFDSIFFAGSFQFAVSSLLKGFNEVPAVQMFEVETITFANPNSR